MSKFSKQVLLFTLIPIGLIAIAGLTGEEGLLGGMVVAGFLLVAYFISAIVCFIVDRDTTGKALLLSVGIILLVGLSVCGIILSSF